MCTRLARYCLALIAAAALTGTAAAADGPIVRGALVGDWVELEGWAPNDEVTLTVGAASARVVVTDASGGAYVPASLHLQDLVPGTEITAASSTASKSLTLLPLTFDFLDTANDEATGTAPYPGSVRVVLSADGGPAGTQTATVDDSNSWRASFDGIVDVVGGMRGDAYVADADGDETVADATYAEGESPGPSGSEFLRASLTDDWIDFHNWEPGPLSLITGAGEFQLTINAQGYGYIDRGATDLDLVEGMTLQAAQGDVAKTLTLESVSFDELDPVADVAQGFGPGERGVEVHLTQGSAFPAFTFTTSNSDGFWEADFTDSYDVSTLNRGWAYVADEDGDATAAELGRFRNGTNTPVLQSAVVSRGFIVLEGAAWGTPDVLQHVEFFSASSCLPSDDAALTLLGSTSATPSFLNNQDFTVVLDPPPPAGAFVVANATDAGSPSSSTFSECVQVTGGATLYVDDDWTGVATGTDPDGGGPATAIGTDAFATIGGAFAVAEPGVTVDVAAGDYNEGFLDLDQPVMSFVGAGRETTHVRLSRLDVSASDFWVEGLDLDGGDVYDEETQTGIGVNRPVVRVGGDVVGGVIRDNRVRGGYRGIALAGAEESRSEPEQAASDVIVEDNDVLHNTVGIMVDAGDGNVLRNNNVHHNGDVADTRTYLDPITGARLPVPQAGIYVKEHWTSVPVGTAIDGNSRDVEHQGRHLDRGRRHESQRTTRCDNDAAGIVVAGSVRRPTRRRPATSSAATRSTTTAGSGSISARTASRPTTPATPTLARTACRTSQPSPPRTRTGRRSS